MNTNDECTYIYDNKGNVTEIYENNNLILKYTYDKQSRLIREDNYYYDTTFIYIYNEHGNISERHYYHYTLDEPTESYQSDYFTYAKDIPNRLIKFNDETFNYDTEGHAIVFRDAHLVWSKSHNLLGIENCTSYEYNQQNVRIAKSSKTEITRYYPIGNMLILQDSGDMLVFIYKDGDICGFSYRSSDSMQDFVYKKNYKGDIVGIYNIYNELICKYIYDAWGNHKILIKHNDNYIDLSILSYDKDSDFAFIANINPYRYQGYYFDTETGLYYAKGKYYDSNLCQYIV